MLLLIRSIKAQSIQITKIKELIREGNSHSYNKCIDASEDNFYFGVRGPFLESPGNILGPHIHFHGQSVF